MPKEPRYTIMIKLRVDEEIHRMLREIANYHSISMAAAARLAIKDYYNKLQRRKIEKMIEW